MSTDRKKARRAFPAQRHPSVRLKIARHEGFSARVGRLSERGKPLINGGLHPERDNSRSTDELRHGGDPVGGPTGDAQLVLMWRDEERPRRVSIEVFEIGTCHMVDGQLAVAVDANRVDLPQRVDASLALIQLRDGCCVSLCCASEWPNRAAAIDWFLSQR